MHVGGDWTVIAEVPKEKMSAKLYACTDAPTSKASLPYEGWWKLNPVELERQVPGLVLLLIQCGGE